MNIVTNTQEVTFTLRNNKDNKQGKIQYFTVFTEIYDIFLCYFTIKTGVT